MNSLSFSFISILLSSVFVFLSHPNFIFTEGIRFFALFSFVPFLYLVKKVSVKYAVFSGFIFGFLSYLLLCNWLITYNIWAGLSVYFLFAFYWSVVAGLIKLSESLLQNTKKNFLSEYKSFIILILKVFILFLFEFISTKGYLGFSYGVSGYSFWKNEYITASSRYFGVWGITFGVILCNVFICEAVLEIKKHGTEALIKNAGFFMVTGTLLSMVFVFIPGAGALNIKLQKNQIESSADDMDFLKVILIQNNCDPWKDGIDQYTLELESLIRLTENALNQHPDAELVVWPETAVVVDVINHFKANKDTRRVQLAVRLFEYINSKQCYFLLGNNYRNYNSAILFSPGDENKNTVPDYQIYEKNHLVPFSEDFPCKKILAPVYRKMLEKGNVFWDKGTGYEVLTVNSNKKEIKIGTPICFEDTFADGPAKMKKNGAGVFVNLSNDSWSDSLACQYQHLATAVFRSAENSIPSVRSTNSGQTCCINSLGVIEQMIPAFTENYLYCEVKLNKIK